MDRHRSICEISKIFLRNFHPHISKWKIFMKFPFGTKLARGETDLLSEGAAAMDKLNKVTRLQQGLPTDDGYHLGADVHSKNKTLSLSLSISSSSFCLLTFFLLTHPHLYSRSQLTRV